MLKGLDPLQFPHFYKFGLRVRVNSWLAKNISAYISCNKVQFKRHKCTCYNIELDSAEHISNISSMIMTSLTKKKI